MRSRFLFEKGSSTCTELDQVLFAEEPEDIPLELNVNG
jgi:hypothetical protein